MLLDDIAATFDDVAIMTKIAVKKTSALMSDDLAVNAAVIKGVHADRELPIVKAIFWGSLLNKVYCITGVLLLTAFLPLALKIVLFIGALYLSYEGAHKILDKVLPSTDRRTKIKQATEKEKIRGAVRTDLILSIEIIVIAESSIQGPFFNQVITLIVVGLLASILIYGLVAILVKVDDLGLKIIENGYIKTGSALVRFMPKMMKGLGILGTIAMLLVGGGIITHLFHIPLFVPELLQNLIHGIVLGLAVALSFKLAAKLKLFPQ